MKKLIIVIPAFNEEASVGTVIAKVPHAFDPDVKVEILVVNDGSTDRTVEAAERAGAEHIMTFSKNRGLGAAVREGLKEAYRLGADLAVMIDADDEYPADHIPRVVAPILKGEADYVLASRFRRRVRGMKLYRRLGNYFFTALQMLLLRKWITDGQTGFRAFSRPVLRDMDIIHDYNYAQVMTMNIVRQGYRLAEVDIPYKVRETGESFITFWGYLINVFPAIWREWRRTDMKKHSGRFDSRMQE
ncbi:MULTISPECIES: glycosyltransferase family 2 protein [Aneurinibacillus]|uniref:Glycosyltransferase family 2 protein n=1 Tax=Aneurinibacillus thermoaerophilus TaxID=143495 RepID=A0A1G7ZM61_ANETH|nr:MULTISPECIES: glycosyltransferase family 2 protein [Aneurinibacillus]AMA72455.1 glycosyl transferase family 2 [Aneurinibacillus sp. XH2]MED0675665.1 glycosyltransferase family 2 protein [Aneurinibacillus thermoaerophilus]MED0679931.1 glycosyltransferase family 2 protein [Aneurinibacillus thermoaerophilus]MED0735566.1 glycosyltransferase family 2 protein [Aneurinibacillus thermoaerophilus]MED0758763.1 glycosyltransferase family 2 protein [Aneurinibacillus thermoaerophilus]